MDPRLMASLSENARIPVTILAGRNLILEIDSKLVIKINVDKKLLCNRSI